MFKSSILIIFFIKSLKLEKPAKSAKAGARRHCSLSAEGVPNNLPITYTQRIYVYYQIYIYIYIHKRERIVGKSFSLLSDLQQPTLPVFLSFSFFPFYCLRRRLHLILNRMEIVAITSFPPPVLIAWHTHVLYIYIYIYELQIGRQEKIKNRRAFLIPFFESFHRRRRFHFWRGKWWRGRILSKCHISRHWNQFCSPCNWTSPCLTFSPRIHWIFLTCSQNIVLIAIKPCSIKYYSWKYIPTIHIYKKGPRLQVCNWT